MDVLSGSLISKRTRLISAAIVDRTAIVFASFQVLSRRLRPGQQQIREVRDGIGVCSAAQHQCQADLDLIGYARWTDFKWDEDFARQGRSGQRPDGRCKRGGS